MSLYDISDVAIPDEDSAPGEGLLTCESCGNSFEHSGRGRKPKKCADCRAAGARASGAGTTRRNATSKDVKAALAVLEGAYSTVALGLMVLSPNAASVWAAQVPSLQAQNEVILSGDPALTKSILRTGEKTGKAAFVIAHVIAFAPVAMTVRADMPKRPKRAKKDTVIADNSATEYYVEDASGESFPNDRFFG